MHFYEMFVAFNRSKLNLETPYALGRELHTKSQKMLPDKANHGK